jgi:hypothetical protein
MPEMFRGFAASLYAFATRRISLFSDFNASARGLLIFLVIY